MEELENDTPTITAAKPIAPLPYKYDQEDERMVAMVKKVASYCGYELYEENKVPDPDSEEEGATKIEIINPDGEKPEVLWAKIWMAIRFISLLTCWVDEPQDTFILQRRHQQFKAEDKCACCKKRCCECDEDMVVVPLIYSPYHYENWNEGENEVYIKGTISVIIGGRPKTVEIPADYLCEHTDYTTDKLYIMREDFPEVLLNHNQCCCLCKRKLTINLDYNAGFDDIPDGLLAAICPIIAKIDSAKIGLNDCATAMNQVVGLLKRKKVGNVEYEWSDRDTGTAKTQSMFTDLFDFAVLAEIEAISRCDIVDTEDIEMGDVV